MKGEEGEKKGGRETLTGIAVMASKSLNAYRFKKEKQKLR